MRLKLLIIFTVFTIMAPTIGAQSSQSDYDRIEIKAKRFFENAEWANANAMYVLMLEQKPNIPSTYANAVVSNIMSGNKDNAIDMLTQAMSYQVPFDSLLAQVRTSSFSIGRGDLYENYLLDIKNTYPWLSRIADNYLMQYYAFRQNGPELIKYAETMLAGLPDNRHFLRMLAHGRLLIGDADGAKQAWLKVISLYPDDYDTILDLANFFDSVNNREKALKWMERACQIRPTPYVTARIAALSAP